MTSHDERRAPATPPEVCPYCGGIGYVTLDVPVGHRLFGKAVPCICKLGIVGLPDFACTRETSNIGHMSHMTFDSFSVTRAGAPEVSYSLGHALELARQFARSPSGWLVFAGPYGCGKTHLAAAIANYRIEQHLPVLFVVVPDLLDYLRAAYAPSSPVTYDQRFQQVREMEVLILDDLGTQNATPWAAEKLYQILNYRYSAVLPTVITTNQALTDMEPRLASRFRDQSIVNTMPIYASDFRVAGRDDAFGSLRLYSQMSFAAFSDRREELEPKGAARLRQVIKRVREYSERPANWLLLRGGYGVGKTHLAAAVANRVAQSGRMVLFVVVSDLLDHLRATFRPGSPVSYDERFNEVRRAWLLVLDDLGVQNSTPWAQEKLFQILNYRYVARLTTILTVSDEGWERIGERLKSRLMDSSMCTTLRVDVPCYRGGNPPPTRRPRRTTRRRM